jgi:hypothetical protein
MGSSYPGRRGEETTAFSRVRVVSAGSVRELHEATEGRRSQMKALRYKGPYEMEVAEVEDAKLEHPNDRRIDGYTKVALKPAA